MAGITGIGSGIDIDSIVKSTVAAERAPKEAQLNRISTKTEAQITALGTLRSALSEFQSTLKGLNDSALYNARTATSSDTARFTATADKGAQAGKYSIEVLSLATASKVSTGAIAGGADASFAQGGTLTIGRGDESFDIEVAAGASLRDVRNAINEQLKEQGITANIVSDPVAGTSRLVLASDKTGAGQDLSISATTQDNGESGNTLDNLVTGVTSQTQAANARIKVDGLEIESDSNTISNVIDGVTLNLLQANPASAGDPSQTDSKVMTLTVANNTAAIKSNLQKFVDSYNKLISTTSSLTKMIPVSGGEPVVGELLGDSSVRNLVNGLRREMGTVASGSDFKLLSDLGISSDKDGKLSVDSKKLDSALVANYDAVEGFLTGENGLMGRMTSRVEGYTQTGGVLDERVKGLNQTRESVKKQTAALDLRMEQVQARLYAQYNAMDSLIGQLSRTSDWMSSALSSLPGVVKKDS
ncbi:flagellar filament capping protein FliD [Ectopseudomonas mendocina]|uniref:flagellar filament capping protein FliD n=1 Tax=Ectopseudomonas mendocina TaxID=300 RepID=UPI001AE05DF2|nr:flagellar filament capping protein FliD [Pseudomonas mendocina]QTN45102.1 flagellar filament capping protein FliD [Pseudomonas mendocina]